MNISCSAVPCPVILNSTCVFYEAGVLLYTGINSGDNLQTALQKIDAKFQDAGLGYIFQNGVIQSVPGDPVKLGGSLTENTLITNSGFTFGLTGTIQSQSFITTGGTSSQFVKGDGSLDGTAYQTAGNYITALTGDGTASGPGIATFTLTNTTVIPNTYGSASQVPVITVDGKGRVTNVSNTPINYPDQLILISGDATGVGYGNSNVSLILNTVNSGVFNSITPLKFAVNAKGLVTGASALTNLDIFSLIGYTPVPQTRTLSINGVTYDLSANRSWTLPTGGTVSSVSVTAGTGISASVTNPTTTPNITITNTAPDQVVVLNSGTGISTSGTYPNFTITNTSPSLGGTVTSVGLSMPSAFTVTNSPVTSSGTLTVTGAGTASQYVRGDGQLATLPSSPSGGGASISYYLNGSIPSSVVGYQQLSKIPVIGTGTDFTTGVDGLIAQFLTDAGDPGLLNIPGGNWLIDMYFSANSAGGTPSFYVELYKYDGAIFTLLASNVSSPEGITNGTAIDFYTTSLAVPTTILSITDRLAIKVYVNVSGKILTLHTEDNNLCEIVTTFSTGVSAINGLTAQVQYLATGTSGSDFNISSSSDTHTFNLPTASATNRGALSTTDWTNFNNKLTLPTLASGSVLFSNGTTIAQDNTNFFWDDANNRLGIGTNAPITQIDLGSGTGTAGSISKIALYSSIYGTYGLGVSPNQLDYVSANSHVFYKNSPSLTELFRISDTGTLTALSLTGTGTRMVTADATGVLSTQAIPTGTVTSVSALTLGTTGTDLSSSVANSTTTPVITLNVPTASATNRGALSSTDWTTFNNKQNALTLTTTGTSGAATLTGATLNIPQYQAVLTNPVTGTGTSGQVAYWNGTSTQTGSNNLFWDNTNNRLGILTNAPNSAFQIGSNIAGTAQTKLISVNDITTTDYSNAAFFNSNIATTRLGFVLSNSSSTNWVNNFLSILVTGASHPNNNYFTNISGKGNDAGYGMIIGQGSQTTGLLIGTYGTTPVYLGTNNNARMSIFSNGNVGINTTTDAGYRLDVNGTTRVIQSSAGTKFTVTGTDNAAILRVDWGTSNYIGLGSNTGNNPQINLGSATISAHPSGGSFFFNPGFIRTLNSGTNSNNPFTFQGAVTGTSTGDIITLASDARTTAARHNPTAGTLNMVNIGNAAANQYTDWSPASGTATFNSLYIRQQINTSGTYAGIVRGILYDPILTSVTGVTHRAIETVTGNVILGSTSGETVIGSSTTTGAKLSVGGSVTAASAIARGANLTPTLVAAANNDVLVGLDINPTFTNGAFTGLTNSGIRVNGGSSNISPSIYIKQTSNTSPTWFAVRNTDNNSGGTAISADLGISGGSNQFFNGTAQGDVVFKAYSGGNTSKFFIGATSGTSPHIVLFPSSGNTSINSTTDAGYKLDVNGTARVQNKLSVGTPSATSAIMEVTSTTQGFLPPRMTTTQRDAIATPAIGLMVYDTTVNKVSVYNGTTWKYLLYE